MIRNVEISEDGKGVVFVGSGKENAKPGSTAPTKVTKNKGKKSAKVSESFPLVEFLTPSGKETVLVTRDEFRIEDNEGVVLARRVQACFPFVVQSIPNDVYVLSGSPNARMGYLHP